MDDLSVSRASALEGPDGPASAVPAEIASPTTAGSGGCVAMQASDNVKSGDRSQTTELRDGGPLQGLLRGVL